MDDFSDRPVTAKDFKDIQIKYPSISVNIVRLRAYRGSTYAKNRALRRENPLNRPKSYRIISFTLRNLRSCTAAILFCNAPSRLIFPSWFRLFAGERKKNHVAIHCTPPQCLEAVRGRHAGAFAPQRPRIGRYRNYARGYSAHRLGASARLIPAVTFISASCARPWAGRCLFRHPSGRRRRFHALGFDDRQGVRPREKLHQRARRRAISRLSNPQGETACRWSCCSRPPR